MSALLTVICVYWDLGESVVYILHSYVEVLAVMINNTDTLIIKWVDTGTLLGINTPVKG